MTSGVLTDTAQLGDPQPPLAPRPAVDDVVRRRLSPLVGRDPWSWVFTGLVTLIAGALRLIGITHPRGKIFDEIYYATEGQELFSHGVEWRPESNTGDFVVHPPLGKWLIGLGEWLFGRDTNGNWLADGQSGTNQLCLGHSKVCVVWQTNAEFGWRISAVVAGTLSVLIVIRLGRRLFGSTALGCAAGLLLALDGMHFVLTRSALLDVFLMFFVLASFTCLVLDRDQRRARCLAELEAGHDPIRPKRAGARWFRAGRRGVGRPGVGRWRLAAGVLIGCAGAVKWSALFYLGLFVILIFAWEIGLRRSAGGRHPWRDTILDEIGKVAAFAGASVAAYLASWSGWFATDTGWSRHWLRDHQVNFRIGVPRFGVHFNDDTPILGPLLNLYQYHQEALAFHTQLTQPHPYQSDPWQWLLLGRPVAFYWSGDCPPGAANCASEVLLLGTPLLWWSFIAALGALVWLGVARRDWRAPAIGLAAATGIVPWFKYQFDEVPVVTNGVETLMHRTMFYFYALPALPFLVLAVVYVLAAIIGGPSARGAPVSERRLIGTIIVGAYLLAIAWCFAYFYPIYSGAVMSHSDWYLRIWLDRWV